MLGNFLKAFPRRVNFLLTVSFTLQTVIGLPMQAVYHSAANFSLPHEYHPERWLPETDPRYDSRFLKDDKEAFQPFSTGLRNCMGQK